MAEVKTEVVKAGRAGVNLLIAGVVIFGVAAVAFAGWNYSKRKAIERGRIA